MHLRTALVLLLTVGLFGWFLRSANLGEVWGAVRGARLDLLFAAVSLVGVTYWARVVRWQYLLRPLGPTRFRTAFRTTVIGFAASFLLPARAGDVLRPYLLARQEGLSASATFATIVLERVLDLIAVLVLLACYVWSGGAAHVPPGALRSVQASAAVGVAAAAGLLTLMFVLASHPERVGALVLGISRLLPTRLAEVLSAFALAFSRGLAAARSPRPLVVALSWSFPLWVLIALQAWCVTRAFGIVMPVAGGFLVQAMLVIGLAVPTPGGVGGFHEAYRVATTTFFGASNEAAVGAALVLHAVSFVPVTIAGVWFMAQDGLSIFGLKRLAHAAHEVEVQP